MRKTRKKRSGWDARLAWIRANRRENSGELCQFCGDRWKRAKTNFYVRRSDSCQCCLSYLQAWCSRGAAAIARRLKDVGVLDSRLKSLTKRGGLRLVSGGRK